MTPFSSTVLRLRYGLLAGAALMLMAIGPKMGVPNFDNESEHAADAFRAADLRHWPEALEQAKASGSTVMQKLITWQSYLDNDSGASFADISRFITENPDWPEQKKLRIHAELSLRDGRTPDADVLRWFGDSTPITGVGKLALARALIGTSPPPSERIASLVKDAWKNGDFEAPEEKTILAAYDAILGPEDDVARADRLLWEEKVTAAEHVLPRLPTAQQKLFKARIALIQNKHNASSLMAQLEPSLKKNPGLIYDRMRFRFRHGDDAGVQEMLLAAPKTLPYPEKWWRIREQETRRAIATGHGALAHRLLAGRGETDGPEEADASWLEGWLLLEVDKKPQEAYAAFQRTYGMVKFPVSRAKASYWAGRAAEAAGETQSAATCYATAAAWPNTYYGQLAQARQSSGASLQLPSPTRAGEASVSAFADTELGQAITMAVDAREIELATQLITGVIENGSDDTAAAAVFFGAKQHTSLGVHGAKKALQHNLLLTEPGYPLPDMPSDLSVEPPLALAIIRQESEFYERAQSASGAIGMMQLLPSTAKETAKKAGFGYSKARLYEPSYNMTLGSNYLARLVSAYDGSYVLAIAAYNAGPGNVRQWLERYGSPGNDPENAMNWVEKIPFQETRIYVQSVMANLQMYRALTDSSTPLKISEDLTR